MADPPRHSLMYNLGAFFGNIVKGAKTDVSTRRHEVSRQVKEETRQTKDGLVTLRRTTIEEVEVRPPVPGPGSATDGPRPGPSGQEQSSSPA